MVYDYELIVAKRKRLGYKDFIQQSKKETTVYKTGKRKIVFVAGKHTFGKDSFLVFLKDILEEIKPQAILLEMPNDIEISTSLSSIPKENWSEREFLIDYALRNRIAINGMDSGNENYWSYPFSHTKRWARKGISAGMAGILLGLLFKYYQYRNNSDLKNKSDSYLYELCIVEIAHELFVDKTKDERKKVVLRKIGKNENYTIIECIDKICRKVANEYYNGKGLEDLLKNMKNYNMATFENYELQKLILLWDSYRNTSMIKECIKFLGRYGRVVAVAGNWHVSVLRTLLAEEITHNFGRVEIESWEEYAGNIKRSVEQISKNNRF